MKHALQVMIATAFLVGAASVGIAGQKEMKNHSGEANTPEKIQRSSPSGEKPLPGGSGPGSRGDQLTETEDVDPKDSKLANKEGAAAQAAKDLEKKHQQKGVSSQSSSKKSHK